MSLFGELIKFTGNICACIDETIQKEKSSTLLLMQPQIDYLTYMVHPLLISIDTYCKEKDHELT
jgi:hypothetical protein